MVDCGYGRDGTLGDEKVEMGKVGGDDDMRLDDISMCMFIIYLFVLEKFAVIAFDYYF